MIFCKVWYVGANNPHSADILYCCSKNNNKIQTGKADGLVKFIILVPLMKEIRLSPIPEEDKCKDPDP